MTTPIKSIRPNQQYDMIIGRFCRSNTDFNTGRVISHDYIIVDEEVMIIFKFDWKILTFIIIVVVVVVLTNNTFILIYFLLSLTA